LNKPVETFTIAVGSLDNNFATLDLSWERTMVSVRFDVPTQKTAMASIDKALAGPTSGDYFSSAQYFYQSNGDMNKALEYVNKALDLNKEKPFWYSRQKSLIQAKLGDKKGAIETAKISLAAATAAKNDDYVKMNNDSIAEWSKK
jgi:tetratricopeptide (TPR) repeat protein